MSHDSKDENEPKGHAPVEARWEAAITYFTDNGEIAERFGIDELDELAAIVELGPDWNAIGTISIRLNYRTQPFGTTIEQTLR